jgi:DNA polymerase III epsilon subunit family exonuclease
MIRLGVTPLAIVDVETTSLHPSDGRIVEVAVIQLDPAGDIENTWSTRVNPRRDPGPTFAHGLTAEMLEDAPVFEDIAAQLARLLDGRILAAHNVNFDANFLRHEYQRANLIWLFPPQLCTIRAAWNLGRRRQGGSRKLVDLCANENITTDDAHTALGDATATARLVQTYLGYAAQNGFTYADLGVDPLFLPQLDEVAL